MAFTDRYYNPFGLPKKRSERDDLLKDAEDTFYGGGNAPRPTPTPTPAPKPTVLAMNGSPVGLGTNAASRIRKNVDLVTSVNQGLAKLDQTVPQPQQTFTQTPGRPMTHTELATDIAKRNLTASGSMLGTPQDTTPRSRLSFVSGGYQYPPGSPLPEGWMEDNAGGLTKRVAPTTAARYSQNPFVEGGYVFPAGSQLPEGFQESGGGTLTRQVPQEDNQTVHFLPPGFTTTVGSTGAPNSTPNDIHFLPPGFTSVQGTQGPNKQLQFMPPEKKDEGYGSAYGY